MYRPGQAHRTSVIAVLWKYTLGHRRILFAGLGLLAAAAAVDVGAVLLMADALDEVLNASSASAAVTAVAAWVATTAAGALLTYLGTVTATRASERSVLALRTEVFDRLIGAGTTNPRAHDSGDVVIRLTEDVVVLETALSVSVVSAVVALLTTAGLIGVAAWLSWQLTLIALIAVPVLMGLARVFVRPQERVTDAERAAHSSLAAALNESVSTVEHARLHNMEQAESTTIRRRGADLLFARIREARVHALFGGILGSAQSLTLIAVSVGGVVLVRTGSLTYGTLIALTGYLGYLYPRIEDIAESRLALVGARVSADRLTEIAGDLTEPPHQVDDSTLDDCTGVPAVDVRNVVVRRAETFELRCPAFRAAPGSLTVVTGASGAGKSTLAAVLAGMISPAAGTVTVAGVGIDTTSGHRSRELVALVSQPAVIRSGTIGRNIGYGSRSDEHAVARAGSLAGVDEFATTFPDGYATPTSFGGAELSAGQRQRIAIARGIARDTPVLLLDEPSTGLDRRTTERLRRTLRELASARTVVVITHDPRLIEAADRTYEVESGVVREVPPRGHVAVRPTTTADRRHRRPVRA